MNRKKILLWASVLALLGWALAGAITVLRANLYTFGQLLYIRRNNISVSALFQSLLVRHSMFILGFMFALMFLSIHVVSATGIDDILKCAQLMLTAAGFDACAWNQDVLFLAPQPLRQFWLHTHDAMLVLFAAVLLTLIIPRLIPGMRLRRGLLIAEGSLLAIGAGLLCLLPPVRCAAVMLPCAGLLTLTALVVAALQFRNRARLRGCLEALMLLPPAGFMVIRALCLFDLRSPVRRFYIHFAAPIIVIYGAAISLNMLVWQLSNLFLQRSQNRRFEEVMKIRTNVANLLVNYCRPPSQQIAALSRLALEDPNDTLSPSQRQTLREIQAEVNKLNRHLRNIGEFETLPSAKPAMQMQPIRLGTIFNYVLDEISEPIVILDNAPKWRELYAMGEPYSLIRANAQFCTSVSDIRNEAPIHIDCSRDGGNIQVEISLAFPQARLRRAKRICRIVNKGSLFEGVEQQADMALYSTHSIFSRHGSPPKAEILTGPDGALLRCRYFLQYCPPQAKDALNDENDLSAAATDGDGRKQVVLLSASPEEIELICSYLAYEPYQVVVVTSEKTLLRELPGLRSPSTLIIGSTFTDSSIYEICWMVREHYTLGQLPILLVQRDPDLRTHVAARKLANSITTALSDRFEFCQKVHTLVELQASVQSTYASRLAFLQAQMNPHFIFNTMNTIMALCLNKPLEAYELLGDFSHYLRSSLFSRDLDKPYPVYEEVDLLTAYLTIEKARFKDQIRYEVVSDAPDDWRILPMLVEPLVENSVKHGKHGARPLNIRVELKARDDALFVLVEDDGAGFEPQKQAQNAAGDEPQHRSIGLENVRARLKLFYNEPLRIESAPGQGTRVSFVLHDLG